MKICAPIALALITASPAGAQSAEGLLKEAYAAIDAKDGARALNLAEQVLRQDPRRAEALAVRGAAKRLLKDMKGALEDYDRALALDPAAHRAYGGRALARLGLKAYGEALRDAEKAVELNPDYARGWNIKGDILLEQKLHREALAAFERSLGLVAAYAPALHGRARCKANLGDPAGAVKDYDAALRLDAALPSAHYNRALSREALKDFRGADEDYTVSIERGHRVPEAHYRRGLARRSLGDLEGARQDWNRALALDPKLTAAGQRLAELEAPRTAPASAKVVPATALGGAFPGLALQLPVLKRPAGDLWVKPSLDQVRLASQAQVLAVAATDPAPELRALPLAELGFAQETLATLAGPLAPEQAKAWAKKWQPYYDFPDPEALAYFQKLNPILAELQSVRAATHQAAQDFDAAWGEAVLSRAVGDGEGAASALAQAERHAQVLQAANAKLADIQKRAQALGNPPDPVAAKARARAWSRKWGGGLSELAKLAYRWRLDQLHARNVDGRMAANLKAMFEPKNATPYVDVWPGDEETWGRWLDGGKVGPEPHGPEPAETTRRAAGAWVATVYDPQGVGPCLRIHFFQNVPAEVAVRQILARSKVRPWALPGFQHDDAKCLLCKNLATSGTPPPATVQAPAPAPKAADDAERKAQLETIAEKEDLIRLIQRNLAKDEAEWAREKDPRRKEDLYLRVLNNRSAIQQERDLIASLKTGELVHTRTPSDAYCHDLMIVRTVEHMAAVDETRRLAAAVEKMASKAEPDQVKQLQEFVGRQISAKDIAEGNVGKARQAAQAVFDSVQGRREQRAARALQDAVDYEDYERRAQRVKTIASVTLLVTGVAAPAYAAGSGTLLSVGGSSEGGVMAVNMLYGGTTGTLEGGPLEGIKQSIAMAGMPGMVAAEMMTGYQRGGLVSSGGVTGAIERGTEAFLAGKLVESVASRIGAWWVGKAKGAAPPPPVARPGLTVSEFVEGQTFQLAKNLSQQRLRQYRETLEKLKAARAKGADAAELAVLEAKRLEQATAINGDFLAKRILKAEGKAARAGRGPASGAELERDFAQGVETINRTQVDPAFRKALKDAGYHWRKKTPGGWKKAGEPTFKEFRHGDAGKTANTDRDLGLEEMAGRDDGAYQLFKGDQPVNLGEAEKDMQRLYEQAYRGATGGDPRAAMQNITTSRSGEAYKDLTYTAMTDPANVGRVKKGWAEQATEVLEHKVSHAGAGQGDFATLFKKIDGANQAAKDIEKRLLPVLQANRAKATGQKAFEIGQDMDRFKAIQRALEDVEKDPVGASRRLKVLTGLDGIGEVSDLVSKRFLGGVKLQ